MKKIIFLSITIVNFSLAQNFWEPTNGPTGGVVYALDINSDGYIFAGTDRGVFRTTDNGEVWVEINNGIPSGLREVYSLAISHGGTIFIGTRYGGIFKSTDNGDDWLESNNGLITDKVYSLAINSSDHIFAGTDAGVCRSTDNGESWIEKNNGISGPEILSLSINSLGYIFAGTNYKICKSTNNGENWITLNNGLPNSLYLSLAINSNDLIFASTFYLIFQSTDSGENWDTLASFGASDLIINSNDHIFAGHGYNGVYRSTNNGIDWITINYGLTDTSIYSLLIGLDGHIFTGTFSGLVFRSINSTTLVASEDANIPSAFSLGQNYPNPFNPRTKIKYSVPQMSFITINVYDILGKIVATLINEEKPIGNYEIEFDAINFSSGVYFYRIQAGNFINTKKLLLIK